MANNNVAKMIEQQQLATIDAQSSVRQACHLMCESQARALAIMQEDSLTGVLSERDVIRNCLCQNLDVDNTRIEEVMTKNPQTIGVDGSLAEALDIMLKGNFHHIPVMKEGEVVGLLSRDEIPEEYRMMLERFKEIKKG